MFDAVFRSYILLDFAEVCEFLFLVDGRYEILCKLVELTDVSYSTLCFIADNFTNICATIIWDSLITHYTETKTSITIFFFKTQVFDERLN